MTNEFDELIWRVLDGKASSEEICRVKEWVQNDEHKRHFKQLQKFWNVQVFIREHRKVRQLFSDFWTAYKKRTISHL